MNLHEYDIVIINSSGGKDSLASLYELWRLSKAQNYPAASIHVSHQDLGRVEWGGTKELIKDQCKMLGFRLHISKRRNKRGETPDLLDYVERRGKWPSSKQRFCTSDFKRGPGSRVVTALTKDVGECRVLYVFGFRASESPARAKKKVLSINKRLSTKTREVHDWLPIHDWSDAQVWSCIKGNGLPYHYAYDLGMPRLSCVFCIFSPKDALVIAGRANKELLNKYIEVEKKIGHSFRNNFSILEIKKLIEEGYYPNKVESWKM